MTKGAAIKRRPKLAARHARHAACAGALALIAFGTASGCGAKSDLIIGSDSIAVVPPEGGGAGLTAAGAGAGGTGAVGGAIAGSSGLGGTANAGDSGNAGEPSAGFAGALDCDPLDIPPPASLLHRYSFGGTGFVATDSIGGANGDLVDGLPAIPPNNDCQTHLKPGRGATLDGNGLLVLDGCRGYVNLPDGLIHNLPSVTIAVWATETPGGASFARYFDFGVGTGPDDTTTLQGQTFLTIAASANVPTQLQLLARAAPNVDENAIITNVNVSDNREHQVVAVFAN
ncbi:MAG TPA: hypothetical protein VHW01_26705, partial [Polyangiaceae bacterium]|nr:hypothetical protein [Polyangiaceae bacterium]